MFIIENVEKYKEVINVYPPTVIYTLLYIFTTYK